MKIYTLLTAILLAYFSFTGCKDAASKKNNEPIEANKKTSNSSFTAEGFTIKTPDGWSQNDTTVMGQQVTLLRSPSEGEGDDFIENMNIIIEKVGDMGLDTYLEANIKSMEGGLAGFEKGSISNKRANNLEFKSMHYSHIYNGAPLEVEVYFTVNDGRAYVITCTTKKNDFERWSSLFDETVSSFKLN